MQAYTIIWDFDGTILPLEPYDSEQSLLLHVLAQSGNEIPLQKRIVARIIIFADRMEWIGKSFKRYYLWVLKGIHEDMIQEVSDHLAEKISKTDRQALLRLKAEGHHMIIASCGTLDLSERILKIAGIDHCFETILGNRLRIENNIITGMDLRILSPADKPKAMHAMGISTDNTIVIGDGYTDLPLLDWANFPVMLDRTGEKKDRYAKRNYHFISSIPEIFELLGRPNLTRHTMSKK